MTSKATISYRHYQCLRRRHHPIHLCLCHFDRCSPPSDNCHKHRRFYRRRLLPYPFDQDYKSTDNCLDHSKCHRYPRLDHMHHQFHHHQHLLARNSVRKHNCLLCTECHCNLVRDPTIRQDRCQSHRKLHRRQIQFDIRNETEIGFLKLKSKIE